MKLITSFFEIIINTILLSVFIGMLVVSGLSVFALSPVPFESTNEYKENVLGLSTTSNVLDIKRNEILYVYDNKQDGITIKNFKGDTGVIIRGTISNQFTNEVHLMQINNITQNELRYTLTIDSNNIKYFKDFEVKINGMNIPVVFDEQNMFYSPITLNTNEKLDFGLNLTEVVGDFQVELIQDEFNRFEELP